MHRYEVEDDVLVFVALAQATEAAQSAETARWGYPITYDLKHYTSASRTHSSNGEALSSSPSGLSMANLPSMKSGRLDVSDD